MISWIDGNSMRLIKTSTDESTLPVLTTTIGRYTKHLDAVISSIGPVQIIVNPVKGKAGNNTSTGRQYCRRVISRT